MKSSPLIVAQGVSGRDAELAALWLSWTTFLAEQPGGSVREHSLLVVLAMSVTAEQEAKLRAAVGTGRSNYFRAVFLRLTDEIEGRYPLSASHLFLRTLEAAEKLFPGHAVLWCEADTVAMKPTWFAEIAAEYATCGKPFMGARVGTTLSHLSGNSVYPANWREVAPSIARVLEAPDVALWGRGRGQPWDTFCAHETTPQMAETKRIFQIWKERTQTPTALESIPAETCLFHQDKTGHVLRALARSKFPQFMSTLEPSSRKFYLMNGHPSRLTARGMKIAFSYTRWSVGGHRSAVCSDELDDESAQAISTIVGQLGVSEITEAEFLRITNHQAKSLPAPRARKALEPVEVPALDGISHPSVFVMLGRFGDIMNILPMLKAQADAGPRPTLVVAQEFASILDGVSYCDRIVWEGGYDRLPDALRWLRRDKGIAMPVVCQVHTNPRDRARLTPSYQTECWRLAGRLDGFATRGPLVFDRRDVNREAVLAAKVYGGIDHILSGKKKPVILVGLKSHSSPLTNAGEIFEAMLRVFSATHEIFDLAKVEAHYVFDLINVFESAACLLCSDTMFLHLSRASKVPLVALINNGWRGSICEDAHATIRYDAATPEAVVEAVRRVVGKPATSDWFRTVPEVPKTDEFNQVLEEILSPQKADSCIIKIEPGSPAPENLRALEFIIRSASGQTQARIFHAYDPCGTEPRHMKAQASWNALYEAEGIIGRPFPRGGRDAKLTVKDPRPLPYLKDIIEAGIPDGALDTDIVLWGNSDLGFAPGIGAVLRQHIGEHKCASMRRTESNGRGHPGRDLVAFTVGWWRENGGKFPDYIIGAPIFDLGIVALFRRFHKLPALTLKGLDDDLHPADMVPGYALHESHEPEWQVPRVDNVPSVKWNRSQFLNWAHKYCPEIKFSPKGALL